MRMTHSRPGRKSQRGRLTVLPSEEWKAQRREQTNHRFPNPGGEDALGGGSDLRLLGLEHNNLYRGGQTKLKRRRVLLAMVPMFWTWGTNEAAAFRPPTSAAHSSFMLPNLLDSTFVWGRFFCTQTPSKGKLVEFLCLLKNVIFNILWINTSCDVYFSFSSQQQVFQVVHVEKHTFWRFLFNLDWFFFSFSSNIPVTCVTHHFTLKCLSPWATKMAVG